MWVIFMQAEHAARYLHMRQRSANTQVGVSAVVGVGTALCWLVLYCVWLRSAAASSGPSPFQSLMLAMILIPSTLWGSAIISGLILRATVHEQRAAFKTLLATPGLYTLVFAIVMAAVGPWRGARIAQYLEDTALFLVLCAPCWPITYMTFRIGRPEPGSDAPPTCHKRGYNLTGNVSGICPECGTAVGDVRCGISRM